MKYNYGLLSWRIKDVCGTYTEFARRVGRTKQYISSVLNNKSYLSQEEIIRWCEVLDIPHEEIAKFFFAREVNKMITS